MDGYGKHVEFRMLTLTSKTIIQALLGFLMAAAAMSVFADSTKKMVATGPDNVAIKGYDTGGAVG